MSEFQISLLVLLAAAAITGVILMVPIKMLGITITAITAAFIVLLESGVLK